MYASDSPSPLVKFELNDSEGEDNMPSSNNPKQDEVKVEVVKKPHKFIYPRLNFFGSGSSNVVADSSAGALPSQLSPARSMAVTSSSQLKNNDNNTTKMNNAESKSKSPYTFFTVDSDDDFDPYGSDVPSDVETKRDLLLSHSLGKPLCKNFTILLTLLNSEQKNMLLIKLFCFSSDFDETW